MSLFKITTSPAPNNPVVGDTEFKDFYPSVNKNMDWCTLKSYIEQAELNHIIPAISQAFFDALNTEYQNDGSIANEEKAAAFRLLRFALAYYTIYDALPELGARIADAGTTENNNQDTMPIRQWVYKETRWNVYQKAYRYLDMALALMEDYINAGSTNFDEFKSSSAYTQAKELLIPNATQFQQYYNIGSSRYTFVALQPSIRKAQQRHIKPLLCELYDELLSEFKSGALSEANEALLPYVQQILAEYVIIESIPDINWLNDGKTWKVVDEPTLSSLSIQTIQNSLQQLQSKAETNAAAFKVQLENFLYQNLDDYPTYKDSDCNQIAEDDDEEILDDDCLGRDDCIPPGAVII
jgi:hypothetical protein